MNQENNQNCYEYYYGDAFKYRDSNSMKAKKPLWKGILSGILYTLLTLSAPLLWLLISWGSSLIYADKINLKSFNLFDFPILAGIFGILLIGSLILAFFITFLNFCYPDFPYGFGEPTPPTFSEIITHMIVGIIDCALFIVFLLTAIDLFSTNSDYSTAGILEVLPKESHHLLWTSVCFLAPLILLLPKILASLYYCLAYFSYSTKGWWILCFINIPLYPIYLIVDLILVHACTDKFFPFEYGSERSESEMRLDSGYTTEKITTDYKVTIGSETFDAKGTREVRNYYNNSRKVYLRKGYCFSILTRITHSYTHDDLLPVTEEAKEASIKRMLDAMEKRD